MTFSKKREFLSKLKLRLVGWLVGWLGLIYRGLVALVGIFDFLALLLGLLALLGLLYMLGMLELVGLLVILQFYSTCLIC